MPIIIDPGISLGPGISVNYVTPPPAGWNISNSSYVRSLALTRTGDFYFGFKVHFKPDGTKMYIGGFYRSFVEYTLSTPWDISTATRTAYRTGYNDAAAIYAEPYSMMLSSDGTKIYHVTPNGTGGVLYQSPLNTAWDLSSMPARFAPYGPGGSPGIISYSFASSVVYGGYAMEFSQDGTALFIYGRYGGEYGTNGVIKFTLGTAWDITTLTYNSLGTPTLPVNSTIEAIAFKTDGTKMFLHTNGTVREYNLATAWDITASTYVRNYTLTASKDLHFKPDGSGFYTTDTGGTAGNIYQYNISS